MHVGDLAVCVHKLQKYADTFGETYCYDDVLLCHRLLPVSIAHANAHTHTHAGTHTHAHTAGPPAYPHARALHQETMRIRQQTYNSAQAVVDWKIELKQQRF